MKNRLLKIASILLILAMLLSLTACFDLSYINWEDFLSYQVDNSYFSEATYTRQAYTDNDNGLTYQYAIKISSSCSVELYKFTADVEVYSASNTLLENKTVVVTEDIAANQVFTFAVQILNSTYSNAKSVKVSFVGRSYENPAYPSTQQKVTVTFVFNNDTPNQTVTVDKGDTVERPSNPQKDGYYFAGWYSDRYFAVKYDFTNAVNYNLTLYAKY